MLASSDTSTLVQQAQAFLSTGNCDDARKTLAQIKPEDLEKPDVLVFRWELAAQTQDWETALALARNLCQIGPENEVGWLWHACSLIELKRLEEGLHILLSAHAKFPKSPAIAYNLACCSAKLKRFEDAFQWIVKASETGGRAEVKLMALSDPDLDPLLDRICALK